MPMTGTSTSRPRVLLLSAGVGAGHNQAAKAIAAGLALADPTLQVEWLDVLQLTSWAFTQYYAGGYNVLVSRLGWLYGLGFRLTDMPRGPRRGLLERRRLWSERRSLRSLERWVSQRLPALIVNTHFLAPGLIAWMRRRGAQGLRQMTVVTDYHAHRWWCCPEVERYFVPDVFSRDRMVEFGTPPGQVEIAGLPVHPKWRQRLEEREIRARWNLPAGRPVVLVAGGAYFTIGGIDTLAAELARRLPQAIIVVLAGTNKHLMGRLAALPAAQGQAAQLRIVSFTDRVDELVQLAWLYVTKSGGMTVTEAAAKGTPLLLLPPVPGQETHNARAMVEAGAAVQAQGRRQAVELAAALLEDRARLAQMADNARQLSRPSTELICRQIVDAVNNGPPT
jgi:processive 1,2-diacylglycerol beta-glucosyltransferase